MNKEKARQILTQSITNLEKRNNGITQGDIEAEVINNACVAIIRNQNEKIGKSTSIKDILLGALNSTQDYHPIANAFVKAAQELMPELFAEEEAEVALMGIEQNLAWDGIWDFLVDYFRTSHGINIEDNETAPTFFFSTLQEMYEDGMLVSKIQKEKTVSITFSEGEKKIVVHIESDLPAVKARLLSDEGDTLKYRNEEKDYIFTLRYDDYEEIESFVFENLSENTEIIYFE